MKWLTPNPIKLKDRVMSLLIDWFIIVVYLGLLFIVFALLYTWLFGTIFVSFGEMWAQVISFVTSVLPVTLYLHGWTTMVERLVNASEV